MNQKVNRKKTQAGFTFVEMMISMTVFIIATGAIFGLLRIATIQKSTASNRTDQLKSARIALEYVRRDAINAGFGYHRYGANAPDNIANRLFNLPNDADTERDLITSIISGNNLTTNTLNTSTNMDFVAFISRDPNFNDGNQLTYTSVDKQGNNVVLNTAANGAAKCAIGDLYLIEPDISSKQTLAIATNVTGGNKITLGFGDSLNLNQSANGGGENLSLLTSTTRGTVKKVNIVSYGVNENGVLIRRAYGNQTGTNQIETRELVYGVSNFQVRYFLEDGTTVDSPSGNHNGRLNQLRLNNIVQIQVTVTIIPFDEGRSGAPATPFTIKEYISTKNLRYEAS